MAKTTEQAVNSINNTEKLHAALEVCSRVTFERESTGIRVFGYLSTPLAGIGQDASLVVVKPTVAEAIDALHYLATGFKKLVEEMP